MAPSKMIGAEDAAHKNAAQRDMSGFVSPCCNVSCEAMSRDGEATRRDRAAGKPLAELLAHSP